MFHKVVVANRGAVAARAIRALQTLGIRSVAVYSDADASAPYLSVADEAYPIGPAPATQSYLNQDALIDVLIRSKADGLHPGYGFLSENSEFATKVNRTGARFIGPSPEHIHAMGNKANARRVLGTQGLPVSEGSEVLDNDENRNLEVARRVGYPLLVKPAEGGGGIGMLSVHSEHDLLATIDRVRSMAERSFASSEVYLESLLIRARHIEFQILADQYGNVCHLFDRDCSIQRRNQKIVEEAPAPAVDRAAIESLAEHSAAGLSALGYDNIGTLETLMGSDGNFSLLEMNTRLQVEHGVTEAVTGTDLVAAQIRSAAGERLHEILPDPVRIRGHAIESRIYAEDPRRFIPSPGTLTTFRYPSEDGVRVETGYSEGLDVTPHYDPLVAKVITQGDTREDARKRMLWALENFEIEGIRSNIPFLVGTFRSHAYRSPELHTGFVGDLAI